MIQLHILLPRCATAVALAACVAVGLAEEPNDGGWGRAGIPTITVEELSDALKNEGYQNDFLGHQLTFSATVRNKASGLLMVSIEGMKSGILDSAYLHGIGLKETFGPGDKITVTGMLVDQAYGVWRVWVYHIDWRPLGQAPARAQASDEPAAPDEEIEQIEVNDGRYTIILRHDGSAELADRGARKIDQLDQRAGVFRAGLDRAEFRRLAALPGAKGIEDLTAPHVAYPQRIVRLTVVRVDKRKLVELHDLGAASAPAPPAALWVLEKAARGVAADLDWKPIPSGVRVDFGRESEAVRLISVREQESHFPVAIVYTHRSEVALPVRPGRYLVQSHTLQGEHWTDVRQIPVVVEDSPYVLVTFDR